MSDKMETITIPSSEIIASLAISILAVIVLWDAYWLTKQKRDIPELGKISDEVFAWSSEGPNEVVRQWGNLFSMAAMMALPWGLVEISDTPIIYPIIWDILLALHLISLLIPKRYAITKTHLFADGQRYEWKRLKLSRSKTKKRIILLRKGWGIFAPLPVGGNYHDLVEAKSLITNILNPQEEE
tara:strand:+ start:12757 stop:13308 length:552 start_codon:yes stop_codon:yes gene_type:complete